MADENLETTEVTLGTGDGDVSSETNTGTGTRSSREQIAESKVNGSTVSFTFTDGSVESCDVAKLAPNVQFHYAVEGVRTAARLSFQKMEDPAKAAAALRNRFAKMVNGEVTASRRSRKPVDDLTQAIMNTTGKDQKHIEDVFYPRFFASKESGCTRNTDKDGKVRIFNKDEALAKLRLFPAIKTELEKIARERAGKASKDGTVKVDLASLAA